ncbi:SDR family NAD(P)-dependent oxidoreductase [Psychromarinibacter sp. C21-152]|uniref:SDR family NAD(P)-dependent oxidoreductase n=1 Tax=Psychromarinibacter sediminicola TaxID=3033385 RepID=A0AAE3NZ99_9RHOB|nr:SDR family NAD(P)-dependent oxidoreductase [Psychromarinibacter sediminicola]MDF0603437.1 SDR family NAD(P)-dependent oxidoreductase [Psychromarinibacter sediminicola]
MHEAIRKDNVAVVTGGASGIGREAARRLAELGMRVCIADLAGPTLDDAAEATGAALAVAADVSVPDDLHALKDRVETELGPVDLLMNNAGTQPGSSIFDAEANWQAIVDTNMWGIIRGSQIFGPDMAASGRPGLIVNTGSKQGITTPPGDPAYNVSKAGVKAFTEALQHELRNMDGCRTEARLFIPGWVFTPLTARGRTEKPEGAWTPEQVVDFLLQALARDDFYILCPDNDVDRATDAKRILWAAGDIAENRPPLSRWHPDYGDAFAAWLKT